MTKPYCKPDAKRSTCKIPWCNGKHFSRGWCGKHHQRWKRNGDPLLFDDGSREINPEEEKENVAEQAA